MHPSSSRSSFSGTPCYVHSRFNSVHVDSALRDLSTEDVTKLTHSRFVQTATGVRKLAKQLGRATIHIRVNSILIITKARDNSLVFLTRELTEWILATYHGITVYVDAKLENSKRFNAPDIIAKDPQSFGSKLKYWTPQLTISCPDAFDLVITLGGDGTVLYASGLFQRTVPPVISFSLGSLGFLTNFSFGKYKSHLQRVFEHGINVNLRMRFTCTVYQADGTRIVRQQVLNELVIDRGPSPFISMLELYGDNHLLTIVQADGLILSTPTGSTAYSLSAGGSLVHPEIPAISVTPICPHTLSFRPMLLPDSMSLKVVVPKHSRALAWVSFDGRSRVQLKSGDYVTVTASQYPFPTVVRKKTDYFDSVSRSLHWNVRQKQKPLANKAPQLKKQILDSPLSPPISGITFGLASASLANHNISPSPNTVNPKKEKAEFSLHTSDNDDGGYEEEEEEEDEDFYSYNNDVFDNSDNDDNGPDLVFGSLESSTNPGFNVGNGKISLGRAILDDALEDSGTESFDIEESDNIS